MIEVELKFEISSESWPKLEEKLAGMHLACRLWNSDTYFDTAAFDLLGQAVFVRLRNQQSLEFKFNQQAQPAHLYCTERRFSLEPEPHHAQEMNTLFSQFLPSWRATDTVHEALHQNGLIELARIENRRVEYTSENLVVCVDQVEGLGEYVEIETQCEEGSDTQQAVARVQDFAAGFVARQVRVGYVELWLQKHHPRAYKRGKYHE